METLNLSIKNSDSKAMCALKSFVAEFINYKCVKTAMEFASDYIDNNKDLTAFETLLNKFKKECRVIIKGVWNDELGIVETEFNRLQIGI